MKDQVSRRMQIAGLVTAIFAFHPLFTVARHAPSWRSVARVGLQLRTNEVEPGIVADVLFHHGQRGKLLSHSLGAA